MTVEGVLITKRKQEDKKKSDSEEKKAELVKDLLSYVESEGRLQYKHLQELFWKYRQEGLMEVNKKIERYRIKREILEDTVSYLKPGRSVEYKKQYKRQVELYWKYRKKGLTPKEAWKKAKKDAKGKLPDR